MRDTTIDKKNRQFADEAELPHITIHEFRHSHASLLINNGIVIQEVSRRLGHSTVEQTVSLLYGHINPSSHNLTQNKSDNTSIALPDLYYIKQIKINMFNNFYDVCNHYKASLQ